MDYKQFVQLAAKGEERFGISTVKECEDLHWNNLIERSHIDPKTPNPSAFIPAYSIDNPISLFPKEVKLWNLNNFSDVESLIHGGKNKKMPGILTPYLYLGMILTSFGLHLEDSDLCSINYLHRGKPKVWYGIPFTEHDKLHELVERLCLSVKDSTGCDFYIRHKTLMIPPSVLKEHGIRFTRIVQNPGEFVLSLSGGYHMGFNCGFNEAEAINFATKRWLEFYEKFKTCSCEYSVLPNDVHSILRPIFEQIRAQLALAKPAMSNKKASIKKKISTKELSKRKSVQLSFSCGECPKTFTKNKNLLVHRRLKHANTYEIYKCPHCQTTRNSAHNFKTHLRTDHGIKLVNVENFVKRIKKTSAAIAAEKGRKSVIRKVLTCDACGQELHGTYNLNRHKRDQHPEGVVN